MSEIAHYYVPHPQKPEGTTASIVIEVTEEDKNEDITPPDKAPAEVVPVQEL